jgi:2-polyprenyl-6-methoxyphenol hydroxylase-like FAD-dependent oxidoreductase
MSTRIQSSYDAVVVGARVAGASTAMLLARAGLRVLAVDKSAYASDTTSTLALMRPGVKQLHRWGVLKRVVDAGTPAIRKTTFHYDDEAFENGVDALYAPRRTVLDAAMVDSARDAGAQVEHGVRVNGLMRDESGHVCGVHLTGADGGSRQVATRIVIGADGAGSNVARFVEAEVLSAGEHPSSCIYGFWRGLDTSGTHWYYAHDCAAGTIPTNEDIVCAFVSMRPEQYSERTGSIEALYERVLRATDPALAGAVAGARRVGKLHPFPGRPGFVRKSWGPGWALVGDAGCFKDPLTAHGMTDALRDAELLANAVAVGTDDALASFEATQHDFAFDFLNLSDEIASFDWDMERAKGLHHRLSKLMNREYELVCAMESRGEDSTDRAA